MELDFNRKEKIVGLFVIGVIILLLATVISIGRGKDWFKKYITYYTTFEQNYSFESATPVKLLNANIGKIKSINLVGDRVKVKLGILDDFKSRIRTDTIATVESPTFIGAEYITILPGSEDAPLIPEGGEIPSKEKKTVADYLNEFQIEKTAKMAIEAIQELSTIVQTIRDPQGPLFTSFDNASKALAHIEKITRDMESGKGTAGAILQSRDLFDNLQNNLNKLGDNLATLEKIEIGVLEKIPSIQKIVEDVEVSVKDLKIIIANIEKGSHDIPVATQSATKGIYEIRNTVENIDKVVQSLQQNFLVKPKLPPEPKGVNVDAGLRP
jgi:phospholipid/cholesterol/gamma-HCH transport system substrate-binding protein